MRRGGGAVRTQSKGGGGVQGGREAAACEMF
jgi:hypothetical protein